MLKTKIIGIIIEYIFLTFDLLLSSWFTSRRTQNLLFKFSFCKAIFDIQFITLLTLVNYFLCVNTVANLIEEKEANVELFQKFVATPLQKQLKAVNYIRKRFYQRCLKGHKYRHCVKSVQMQSFFLSVFSHISLYSAGMQENTDQKKLRIWTLFTQWYLQSCW